METKTKTSLPRALIWIILISLLLHVAGLLFVLVTRDSGKLVYGDAQGYVQLAQNLRQGFGFVTSSTDGTLTPQLVRTPGLPFLLVPFVAYSSGLIVYLILLTVLSGLLLPYFVWWIGRRLFNERVSLIAACITAFEPMLIFFSWSTKGIITLRPGSFTAGRILPSRSTTPRWYWLIIRTPAKIMMTRIDKAIQKPTI